MYIVLFFFFLGSGDHLDLHEQTHSFPTRRSSDLAPGESNGKFFVKYEKLACPVRSANNRGFRLGGNRKVDWGWIVWGLDAAVHEALLFAAVGFLVGGIDDLAIDAIFLVRIAWRRASVMRRYRRARLSEIGRAHV